LRFAILARNLFRASSVPTQFLRAARIVPAVFARNICVMQESCHEKGALLQDPCQKSLRGVAKELRCDKNVAKELRL
jgi:hypothetical protein